MKLGKAAPKFNEKTLALGKYLTGELPSPSAKVFREYKIPDTAKQMYGNDRYGDCVWAMSANAIILATVHTGTIVVPTLEQVLAGYSAVTGFNPQTGVNDNGTAMTDALDYLRTSGLAGHKILAWAQIDHTNLLHRKIGVDLFGMTLVGVQLPANAQEQFANGQSFEVSTVDSEIEGGHAILHVGYGSEGDDYVTWAKWDQKASAKWSELFVDEEYVIITEDWFNQATRKTPGGIDLATLEADLKLISA
jgi:hypothetical protein